MRLQNKINKCNFLSFFMELINAHGITTILINGIAIDKYRIVKNIFCWKYLNYIFFFFVIYS